MWATGNPRKKPPHLLHHAATTGRRYVCIFSTIQNWRGLSAAFRKRELEAGSLVDFTREIGRTQSWLILIVLANHKQPLLRTSRACTSPLFVHEGSWFVTVTKKCKISELKCERSRGCARLNLIISSLQSVFIQNTVKLNLNLNCCIEKNTWTCMNKLFWVLSNQNPLWHFWKLNCLHGKPPQCFFIFMIFMFNHFMVSVPL